MYYIPRMIGEGDEGDDVCDFQVEEVSAHI